MHACSAAGQRRTVGREHIYALSSLAVLYLFLRMARFHLGWMGGSLLTFDKWATSMRVVLNLRLKLTEVGEAKGLPPLGVDDRTGLMLLCDTPGPDVAWMSSALSIPGGLPGGLRSP